MGFTGWRNPEDDPGPATNAALNHVAKTYLWQNGMAMVFDEHGEQIPELQGRATPALAEAIRRRSTPATIWVGWGEDGPAVWPSPAVEAAYYGGSPDAPPR